MCTGTGAPALIRLLGPQTKDKFFLRQNRYIRLLNRLLNRLRVDSIRFDLIRVVVAKVA